MNRTQVLACFAVASTVIAVWSSQHEKARVTPPSTSATAVTENQLREGAYSSRRGWDGITDVLAGGRVSYLFLKEKGSFVAPVTIATHTGNHVRLLKPLPRGGWEVIDEADRGREFAEGVKFFPGLLMHEIQSPGLYFIEYTQKWDGEKVTSQLTPIEVK